MKYGIALLIWKKGSGSKYLVDILNDVRHKIYPVLPENISF
jgi:hypothetical protein